MKIVLVFVCLAVGGIVVETIAARLERASGGTPISFEAAPHFVSLRRKQRQVCGGSLISTEHVLTAAHCVVDGSFRGLYTTRVISGSNKYDQSDYGHGIESIFLHEGYIKEKSSYDITVIKLLMPVEWISKQNTIALPDAGPQDVKYATLNAFKLQNTEKSKAGLLQLMVTIHFDRPTPNSTDDPDQVFYGTLKMGNSISKSDLGGALVSEGRIVGVAFKTPQSHYRGCYFINVVKFKTFIEGCLNSGRSSVISWAPKRPRL